MTGSTASAPSRFELVYTVLRDDILHGDLLAGERINEEDVAKRLGVSRTPVREAIRQLERDGLVRMERFKGCQVIKLDVREILDLFEARQGLEGMAARLAAHRLSDEAIAGLATWLDRRATEVEGGGTPQGGRRFDFHDAILQGSRNTAIIGTSLRWQQQLSTFRTLSASIHLRRQAAYKEHRLVLDRIAERDADGAEEAMRIHLHNVLENIKTLLDRHGDRGDDRAGSLATPGEPWRP